jgi:predicted Ser/Thr protein kinase
VAAWSDELLKQRILERRLLAPEVVEAALREQEEQRARTGAAPWLGSILVRSGKLREVDLAPLVDADVRRAFDEEEDGYATEAAEEGVEEDVLRDAREAARRAPVPRRTAEVLAETRAVSRGKLERLGKKGASLPAGAIFGKFRIVERLGRGGMGEVYKAVQPGLDRVVAIKVLPPELEDDPASLQRFQRESQALARLNHPNIVTVFEAGIEGGRCFFVMEYVDGPTLRDLMKAKELDPALALRLVPQICDALEYAHAEGIVHRDVKPANILIDRRGRVKVADFGLARVVDPDAKTEITRTKAVLGTACYMAPEQVENPKRVDHRADIYSLGVVLYEMLTGELPLGRFEPPSRRARVDARIDDVVLKALEKSPDRRFQRVAEVKVAVDLAGTQATAAAALARRRRLRLGVGVVLVAAVATGASFGIRALRRRGVVASTAGTAGTSGASGPGAPASTGEGLLGSLVLAADEWPRGAEPRPDARRRLPANPLLAAGADEKRAVVTLLEREGRLPQVDAGELERAYFAGMGDGLSPAYAVLDFADEGAARRVQRGASFGWGASVWADRRGSTLVYAYHAEGPREGLPLERYRFEHLVNALRRRLGVDPYDFGRLAPFYLDEGHAPPALEGRGAPEVHLGAASLEALLRDEWHLRVDPRDVACVYRWRFVETATGGAGGGGTAAIEYIVARSTKAAARSAILARWRKEGGDPVASGADPEVVGVVLATGDLAALTRARAAVADLEKRLRDRLR